MDDSPEPDSFEKRVRFGCGFMFGAIMAFSVVVRAVASFTGIVWAAVGFSGIVFGFLAMRQGNRFWRGISDWFRWW